MFHHIHKGLMMRCVLRCVAVAVAMTLLASVTFADSKIDEQELGAAGKWAGYTISRHGMHVAVLSRKGSRFVVTIDGAEGPRIDQLIALDGTPFNTGASNVGGAFTLPIPVLFCDDGTHSAYLAKVADDYILVCDNKETARGKYASGELNSASFTMAPSGQHVYYYSTSSSGQYQVVVDGKPGPSSHTRPELVLSPDGSHYAYVGTQPDSNQTKWAVVDGKQVKHFGDDLRFTSEGHLLALQHEAAPSGGQSMTLNIDNKPVLRAGNIGQMWISPHGKMIAAMVNPQPASPAILTVNGKPVPGTEGALISAVCFSNDDQHFAAICSGSGQSVILDGKKGQSYQVIHGNDTISPDVTPRSWQTGLALGDQAFRDQQSASFPCFSGDSSKFLYVAQMSGQSFLVSNEDESDGVTGVISPVCSPDGKHVAYIASTGAGGAKPCVVIDGKPLTLSGRTGTPGPASDSLSFSPDSAHWVCTSASVVYLDGVEVPDIACPSLYAFSPDGKHLLLKGTSTKDFSQSGMFLDGKLITAGPGVTNPLRPTFTPDSKHVFWIGNRPSDSSTDHDNGILYVDGKPTATRFAPADNARFGNWQTDADNTLTFIARSSDSLKRYHVIPDPSVTLENIPAETVKK
jgi:hypothetical protein